MSQKPTIGDKIIFSKYAPKNTMPADYHATISSQFLKKQEDRGCKIGPIKHEVKRQGAGFEHQWTGVVTEVNP